MLNTVLAAGVTVKGESDVTVAEFLANGGKFATIPGTDASHPYKVLYANDAGVVGLKDFEVDGEYRIRCITWDVLECGADTDDYSPLEEAGWEEKGGHHVSLHLKDRDEAFERCAEAIAFLNGTL